MMFLLTKLRKDKYYDYDRSCYSHSLLFLSTLQTFYGFATVLAVIYFTLRGLKEI